MKKNTIKAFTLVEMLIVIVIIGILIASLMPRMQAAQGRARDVARKNDLAQIQTAIISSQSDRRKWPELESATGGMAIEGSIEQTLIDAGMSSVPTDPNGSNAFSGLNGKVITGGRYGYMVATRNGVSDGGFVLMAKTETEGGSNWVVCDNSSAGLTGGYFTQGNTLDLKNVKTCQSVSKKTDGGSGCTSNTVDCIYETTSQLRYILLY